MKFLSVIILLGLMVWTWDGYKSTTGISAVTHFELQNELKDFITGYIQQKVEGSSNIRFLRFWTEETTSKEIRAVFEYTFDITDKNKETATTQLKGFAYLNPQGESNEWSLDRVEINDQVIEFKNGSVINAEPPTAPSAEPKEHK